MPRTLALALALALASPGLAQDPIVHEWGYFIENQSPDPTDVLSSMPREVPSFRTWSTTDRLAMMRNRQTSTSGIDATDPYRPPPVSFSSEPYIYFYSDRPMKVSVRVDFPGGQPLYWWPIAIADGDGQPYLEWRDVQILPAGARPRFHRWSKADSLRIGLERARQVAANPLEVQGKRDRYLFYEGTMNTSSILERYRSWDGLHLRNASAEPLREILVFQPGSDLAIRHELLEPGQEIVVADDEQGTVPLWKEDLARRLEGEGLFADEAAAMAASVWDTAFLAAPGTRVLYTIPRETYDAVYPLRITPRPSEIVRVGLVLSFDIDQSIETALAKMSGTYLRHPVVRRVLEEQLETVVTGRIDAFEPLSPAMRRVLERRDPEMALLRQRLRRDYRDPDQRRQEIDDRITIALGEVQADPRDRRRAVEELARLLPPYLYNGEPMTASIEAYRERQRQNRRWGDPIYNAIGIPAALLR